MIEKLTTLIKSSMSPFMQDVLLLSGGTLLAQVIGIIFMPMLTRLYSAADFGLTSIYSSILVICGSFTALCYHIAIPLPQEKKKVFSLVILSISIQIALSVLFFAFLFIFSDSIFYFLKIDGLLPYKWLLPAGFLGSGIYQILSFWALKKKAFKEITKTKIIQTTMQLFSSISLGYLSFKPIGLLLGNFFSHIGGITSLSLKLIRTKATERLFISPKDIFCVAKEYNVFPLYRIWSGLLGSLSIQMMPLMLGVFFNLSVVGWYSFSLRILQLPIQLIGQSTQQVFFQRASEAVYTGNLPELVFRTYRALVLIATFPIICLSIIAPHLFSFVFGEEWFYSGLYARFLAPWILANFCFSSISNIFAVLKKQKLALVFQLSLFSARFFALFLASSFPGIEYPILFFGLASFVIYIFAIQLEMKISGNSPVKAISLIFKEVTISLIFLFPTMLAAFASMHSLFLVLISFICYAIYLFNLFKVRHISILKPLSK